MSNRAAVKRRIRDIATVAIASVDLGVTGRDAERVKVAYATPPDEATESCLYLWTLDSARTDGRTDPTGMRQFAPMSDDTFTVKCTIDASGFDDAETAEEAVERIKNAFAVVLHRCTHLVDPQAASGGVPTGDDPSAYDVQRAFLADWTMEPGLPGGPGDTWIARIVASIGCVTTDLSV